MLNLGTMLNLMYADYAINLRRQCNPMKLLHPCNPLYRQIKTIQLNENRALVIVVFMCEE